jgi:EmrB/QacA subfamily drug resistance transporter
MRAVLPLAGGATFLAMLDTSVTNLAIPDLHHDFTGPAVADLTWVITAYAVLFAAVLTPAGRLADVIGRRRLYVTGVGLFTLMSLACALAPNLGVLVAARAVQGAGAAAMIPASLALLLHGVPPARRMAAVGLWSAAGALAAAVGPSVGGLLVDVFGWRSVFLVNLPLGMAMIAAARLLPAGETGGGRRPDLLGTVLLSAGIGGVVLGVTEGDSWHWTDPRTLASLLGGVAVTGYVLVRSSRHPAPAVETSLWRSRGFAVANAASLLYGATLYAWLLIGVLFLTEVWRYSELKAGLAMSPGAFTAAASAVAGGRLIARFGPRPVVAGGAATILACGLTVVSSLQYESWVTEPHFLIWWLPLGLLLGVGMGAVTTGTAAAAALSAPPTRFAGATGLNTAARQVGGAFGIAALALVQRTETGLDAFTGVYAFCAVAVGLCGLVGLGLAARPAPRPAVSPAPAVAR